MNAACHVCGATGLEVLPGLEALGLVSSDCRPLDFRCQVALCGTCGVVQKPVDEPWRAATACIYDGYCIYHQSGGLEQPVFQAGGGSCARSDRLLDWALGLGALPESGRLADVGCGNGGFLRAFARRRPGWRLCGLEWGERHCEIVLGISGVEAFEPTGLAGLARLAESGGRFDAIVLVHALEHFPDLRQALAGLHGCLKPGGLLLILVPDHAANPFDLLVADHCTHFSAASLRRELTLAGYGVEALAEGTAIAKELAVLARRSELVPAAVPEPVQQNAEARQRAQAAVEFLAATLAQAREASRQGPVGIFGTSIGGVWLAAQLGAGAAFFVDEDQDRVGRELMGLPVLAPEQVAAGSAVVLPLAPVVARAVAARLGRSHPGVRWIGPNDSAQCEGRS
jgi:SAM-dependent methyltransferase